MTDFLYSGRVDDLNIAFTLTKTTAVANETVLRHNCDPVSAHILSRATTAGLLCAPMLAEKERLNIRYTYSGVLKTVLVDVGQDATVRSLASPTALADQAGDRVELYGESCEITVVKTADAKILNSGTTSSIFQDEVDDLSFYFSYSDQIETGMLVMVGFEANIEHPVNLCQGLKLQALPSCDLERFERIRQRLNDPVCRALLMQPILDKAGFKTILQKILEAEIAEPSIHISDFNSPKYECTCSIEKMPAVLNILPYDDRMDIVKKGEDLKINCQYCNEQYTLSIEDCIKAWNQPAT